MTSKLNFSARGCKGVKENKFTNIDKEIRVLPDITSSFLTFVSPCIIIRFK